MSDAYKETAPYPLDVLGSETEGQIGYVLELELSNAIPDQETVAVLTRVVVDPTDPAFSAPSKFIGPVYSETEARSLAEQHGWTVKPDGQSWRRVVPSPEPRRIVQLDAIERLIDAGFLVVCTGGGGIPVVEDQLGHQRGVEAVIDKDLASALLAERSGRGHARAGHRRGRRLRRLRHPAAAADRPRHAGGTALPRISPPGRWAPRSRRCAASSSAQAPAPRSGASTDRRAPQRPRRNPGASGRPRLNYGERKARE